MCATAAAASALHFMRFIGVCYSGNKLQGGSEQVDENTQTLDVCICIYCLLLLNVCICGSGMCFKFKLWCLAN